MILIDPSTPTPPFEQIRVQLAEQIRSGTLAAGTRLPTVRRLAQDLGLAVNTVARAYRELETAGLVEARGRNGTTVTWSTDLAHGTVERAAAAFASRVFEAGYSPVEARRLIDKALGLR